jgi:hypothetical protein
LTTIGPNPLFSGSGPSIATLPSLSLDGDEQSVANWLATRLFSTRPYLELTGYYYNGLQKMQDLGISIPPQLKGLRTVVGWPAIGVDALVNRTIVEGFRFPGATDVDDKLMGIWQANDCDGEAPLAHLDAFVYGRAYSIVGPGDESTQGEPLITYESPLNMIGNYDARLRRVTAAFQIYLDTTFTSDMFGHEVAALYLPGKTIHMAREAGSGDPNSAGWQIVERDDHNLGYVPIARLANRMRLADRAGKSEIRASWMNTVDSATRTLLGMEVGREFHIAPRRYALGVTEEAFQNSDGTAKSAWDAYLNKVWMLERDEDGQLPTLGQFPGADPSGYTKMLDLYSSIMSGEMGCPPHMLGIHPDGNPASADAIRSGYQELTSRSLMKQVTLSSGHEDTMRLALLVREGSLPPNAMRIETDWRDPAPETLAGTSDALFKQISSGMIPPTSDVTLKKAGYSAVERARLEQDRLVDDGTSLLNEIAHSLIAKDVKVDKTLLGAVDPAADPSATVVIPKPGPGVFPAKPPAKK